MLQGRKLHMELLTAVISKLSITDIPFGLKLPWPVNSQQVIPGNKPLANRRQMYPFKKILLIRLLLLSLSLLSLLLLLLLFDTYIGESVLGLFSFAASPKFDQI